MAKPKALAENQKQILTGGVLPDGGTRTNFDVGGGTKFVEKWRHGALNIIPMDGTKIGTKAVCVGVVVDLQRVLRGCVKSQVMDGPTPGG